MKPKLDKRAAMEAAIRAGRPFDEIARQLGYKNAMSALVMAHRWGLNTLHPRSFMNRNKTAQR